MRDSWVIRKEKKKLESSLKSESNSIIDIKENEIGAME